jgi:MFS family permease
LAISNSFGNSTSSRWAVRLSSLAA